MKIDGYEYTILAQISAIPHMKKQDANRILKQFSKLGQPEKPVDIKGDRERLRRILQGKAPVL